MCIGARQHRAERCARRARAGGLWMDANGKIRGALLLGRMRYVRKLGEDASRRILDALTAKDRLALVELRSSASYSSELLLRLDAAIATESSNGNREEALIAIGQWSADASFGPTGTLRSHAGTNDPHSLLREVPRVHAGLQGAGPRGYERVGAHAAVVRSVQGHCRECGDCLTNVGWLRRAIELSGGRDVQVTETACIGRGGSCCEFRCEWR